MGITAGVGAVVYGLYQYRPQSTDHRVMQEKIKQLYRSDEEINRVAHAVHNWWTKDYVLLLLKGIRERLNVPCWTSIMLVTIGLRCLLVPVNIALLRTSLRMKIVLPEVQALARKIKDRQLSEAERLANGRHLHRLLMTNGCNPWAQLLTLPLLLPPLVLSVFGAVHEMCMTEPAMEVEGALWFPDLIERDETQLLAIISALTWLLNIEMGAGAHYTAHNTLRTSVRLGAVAMISLSSTLPSGVFVFWITSNVFALTRGYIMRSDVARRVCRIPSRKTMEALSHLPKTS